MVCYNEEGDAERGEPNVVTSRTKWQSITIDEELLAQLMENLEIHRTIARMLIRRGIKDVNNSREIFITTIGRSF